MLVAVAREVHPWPLSGTVVRKVEVPMTVNGEAFTLDLATRRVARQE